MRYLKFSLKHYICIAFLTLIIVGTTACSKEKIVPTASFDFTITNLGVLFNNKSTNAVSYRWDFGDGYGSSLQTPHHSYANETTYTVTLEATSSTGNKNITTRTVDINQY